MLTTLATAIKERLEGTAVFKAVDQGFTQRVLKSPPSAVFFLVEDEEVTSSPYVTRKLTWQIAMLVSYLDPVKGQVQMDGLVDAVRPVLIGWLPVARGCLPTSLPRIGFEGVEESLLIYTARMTMQVVPENIP